MKDILEKGAIVQRDDKTLAEPCLTVKEQCPGKSIDRIELR